MFNSDLLSCFGIQDGVSYVIINGLIYIIICGKRGLVSNEGRKEADEDGGLILKKTNFQIIVHAKMLVFQLPSLVGLLDK